jgi:hypothetical protein
MKLSAFCRLLISIIFFCPFIMLGQVNEPFKGATKIFIKTNLSSEEAYKAWGKHLAQNGYGIGESSSEFLTFTTETHNTSKFNYEYVINSVVLGNGVIKITMKWRLKKSVVGYQNGTDFYDWEYAKSSGNVQKIIFDEVYSYIKLFGEYELGYE